MPGGLLALGGCDIGGNAHLVPGETSLLEGRGEPSEGLKPPRRVAPGSGGAVVTPNRATSQAATEVAPSAAHGRRQSKALITSSVALWMAHPAAWSWVTASVRSSAGAEASIAASMGSPVDFPEGISWV